MSDILQRGTVNEGHSIIKAIESDDRSAIVRCPHLYRIRAMRVTPRDNLKMGIFRQLQNHIKLLIIIMINQHFHILEEFELFDDFANIVLEELGMRSTDISQNTDGGIDNIRQSSHFVGSGDTRLKNGDIMLVGHLPDGKRHPET